MTHSLHDAAMSRSPPSSRPAALALPPPLPTINLALLSSPGTPRLGLLNRPRLVVSLAIALVFYLGWITGSGSRVGNGNSSSVSLRRGKLPFLVPTHRLPLPERRADFRVEEGGGRKIPRYVHYVFGMSEDFGGKQFGFIQFAALQSAVQILKPEIIFFHYLYQPTGWWYERALEVKGFKPVKVRQVTEVFGNPIEHFAHKADIIRLEALKHYGGIYLDTDIFLVRSLDPLLSQEVVMAEEAQPSLRSSDPPSGLCNAVILARPYAPFIQRWIESYRDFDKGQWATHSVTRPWELALMHPNEITVLDRFAFFYPLWHEDHVDLVHKTTNWDFDRSGQYLYHAWESLTWSPHLQNLDPDRIHVWGEGETSFTRFVRRYIHEDLRNQWRQAKSLGLVT